MKISHLVTPQEVTFHLLGRYLLSILANITLSIVEHLNKYNCFKKGFPTKASISKGITIMGRGYLPLVDQSSVCQGDIGENHKYQHL